MTIIPINDNNSDFKSVNFSKGLNIENITPYCAKHGAMNKVSVHQDNGGIWRCLELTCRTGCIETRNN